MVVIKVNYTNDAPIIKVNYDDAPIYISTTVDATYISVDYGAGDGSAVWGHITGTLSDQTDLQNALDAKVPYTGAIANVDLGEYELKAGQVEFDQTPTGTAGVGVMRWNDQDGTLDLGLKGGNVTLQVGQEQVVRVVNKTGANLLESEFKAVRISGAQGQRLGVALAQANNDNNSADTIGLVTENIDNNQEGFITTMGTVREINTTGSVYGETWADGDVLYLSPTTAGAITNVKPVAPQHIVVLGYVEYAHANHGKIFVKVMNGWELGELHDVDTTGATAGQVLKYNGTIWTPSSDLDTGITSLNGLTALTQTFATGTSGTDFNISSATSTHTFNLPTASAVNRGLVSSSDWSTFNAKIGGTLATGQVAFGSAANTIAGSNNLFWNAANNSLQIGGTDPFNTRLYVNDRIRLADGGGITNGSSLSNGEGVILSSVNGLRFFTANTVGLVMFNSTRNLLLQNGGTFTDGGQRLQVQGDAFIKGSGNTSGTTALTVQNSSGTNALRILNDSTGFIPFTFYVGQNTTNPLVYSFDGGSSTSPNASGRNFGYFNTSTNQTGDQVHFALVGNTLNPTSGDIRGFQIDKSFSPTSGTALFTAQRISPTINQTGGANGITRGLYVNPTLTAAADWRSIEWSNNTGWGLYGAGTSANYLNGNLGIGTFNSLTNNNLRVAKNLTGLSVANGIVHVGQVQSDVTSVAQYFVSVASTQAAAFSTEIRHYTSQQGIFGAGSTVTAQYGFLADATLIGGTSNFGFYGNIPSGTNRWNLYMNGTANNYMAGRLALGSTAATATRLISNRLNLTGGTTAIAYEYEGLIQSDVTSEARIYSSYSATSGTFTLAILKHFQASAASTFSATVTNQFGYFADAGLTAATNNYGFYGNIASGTGRWNFFAAGTAANYLNGNTIIGGSAVDGGQKLQVNGTGFFNDSVGIGVTNLTGFNFRVAKSLSGSTNVYGIFSEGAIQSTATSSARYFGTYSSVQNTAFTLTDLHHFFATGDSSFGSATVTNQHGFLVSSNLTGATNNYGFRGQISAGTNRYNIFMDGTAQNYVNGNFGVKQSVPTASVDITGSTTANASLRIRSGTAPTSPNDGDIWFDGTDLKMRIGGVTKTFTLV